ncbi:MAG: succinate dehydrogenase/fumarate reductase iron-sulfur subunit [Caldilineaceae bacterium]|jgi:succinate dehydrogenase / fumarate reductase iron-sulfur subunit
MRLKLRIWRQQRGQDDGQLVEYELDDVSPDESFLEMMDSLNNRLTRQGDEPVAFDHDCREGICGMCSMVINGVAHGPKAAITTCQLHMRTFSDGDTITVEPWRAEAFPIVKDLIVDRTALDRIIQAGGFISISTGSAPEANATAVSKPNADEAMDAAACIGCGACVAACPNSSAMLFTAAKISHLGLLPQGKPERYDRAVLLVDAMEKEGFGGCSNIGECSAVCPKEIGLDFISRMNRDYIVGKLRGAGRRLG